MFLPSLQSRFLWLVLQPSVWQFLHLSDYCWHSLLAAVLIGPPGVASVRPWRRCTLQCIESGSSASWRTQCSDCQPTTANRRWPVDTWKNKQIMLSTLFFVRISCDSFTIWVLTVFRLKSYLLRDEHDSALVDKTGSMTAADKGKVNG